SYPLEDRGQRDERRGRRDAHGPDPHPALPKSRLAVGGGCLHRASFPPPLPGGAGSRPVSDIAGGPERAFPPVPESAKFSSESPSPLLSRKPRALAESHLHSPLTFPFHSSVQGF